jgi:hypothetical protein
MDDCLSRQEQERRKQLSNRARAMIVRALPVDDADDTCVTLAYDGFYLQIAFSEYHPLLVLYLARGLNRAGTPKDRLLINELNLKGVLGSHALGDEAGCYSYKAAHWLDAELTQARYLEILRRCAGEATRGFRLLTCGKAS